MSGIFNTLNTASKGLQAQQTALHTTSHNISNANTEGYSRQRVDLKADLAYNFAGVGQLGTGVKMDAIVRLVDDYVSKQIRQENGTMQRFSTKSDVLEQLEMIFNEPSDTGLNFNLGQMFDSWQELSKNPESLNSKTIVVEKAKTLADTLNHMSNQIDSLSEETIGQIKKTTDDFNSIVSQLDTLNKQIFNISVKGQIPNDLLDQRDLMLKKLSSITDFNSTFDNYGRVNISIGNKDTTATDSLVILDATGQKEIALNGADVVIKDTSKVLDIKSGVIKGYTEALSDLIERKEELNIFTKTMADAINTAHKDGMDVDEYNNLFTTQVEDIDGNPVFTAGGIKVNQVILRNNDKINAGATSASAEGDGSRALTIAAIRNQKFTFGGASTTIEGAYRDIATKVGISKEHADNMVANQDVLLDQLVLRRESTSGVSIDEEVSNLIKFQKSYEANAKVISVLTEMLDTLINRTGV